MKKEFLEAGKIVNTHGVRGEVKVEPWCDSPDFLASFERVFIDGKETPVLSARVHKNSLLMLLEGVGDINEAMRLRGKIISIARADVSLEDGRVFVQDIIGLPVFDARLERQIGLLEAIEAMPAHDVYVVNDNGKRYMIPAVSPFLEGIDEGERIRVRTIAGMLDED